MHKAKYKATQSDRKGKNKLSLAWITMNILIEYAWLDYEESLFLNGEWVYE